MENNYTQYAVINAEIDKLKKKKDKIKEAILTDMANDGIDKAETSVGKFTISKLKTWTYTSKVEELNEEYKAQKAHEEITGEATFVEKPSLRFTKLSL